MRFAVKAALFAVLVAVAPSLAYAQASITGVVRDASGAVLPGVTVEAASPALIEKVRSTVSGDSGQYRIENLRPGTYSVTFSLPGFSTVVREGLELSGSFTATINADLRVGGVEETITVTGESPVVDVQSTTRQRVMDREVIDAIPTGRSDKNLAMLIPGVTLSTTTISQDVGGTADFATSNLSVHGSRNTDQRITQGGLSLGSASQGGGNTFTTTNMGAFQEVAIDVGAADAEQPTGGVRINFVPKDGGNRFSGSTFVSYAGSGMQGNNFNEDLRQILSTPDALKRSWDFNPSFGGPIMRDRLWFHLSYKNSGNETYPAGIFRNLNANNPNAWTYAPDRSSRPFNHLDTWDAQGRLTWQASQKLKMGITYQESGYCGCSTNINESTAPEAGLHRPLTESRNVIGDWSMPLTNQLLLDGGALYRGQISVRIAPPDTDPRMISVTEQSLGNFVYRTVNTGAGTSPQVRFGPFYDIWYGRAAMSYITGAHAVRGGFNVRTLKETQTYGNLLPGRPQMDYRFNNGIPNQITLYGYPLYFENNTDADHGLFIQDKWTMGRLTLSGGLRYDYYKTSFPAQQIGPTDLLPNRNFSFPETPGVSWHDLAPKSGLAYDVFGNGKTALKLSMNKYVEGMGSGGPFGTDMNPAVRLSNVTTRSWTDSDGDFVPDCNLSAPELNGECGAMANRNFGTLVGGASYDPETLKGWNIRPYNWEFTVGVQQEILPRVSLDMSYYRRAFGNFYVTDNRAVEPSDFTEFSIPVPASDDRLPTAGETIRGYYNLNPNKVGLVDDYITNASNYGDMSETWTGLDVTINARIEDGLLLQGGTSTGRTATNSCEIRARLPETALTNPFCNASGPFVTQAKFLAAYTVPKIDVQLSGTLQSLPGPLANANFVATNAIVQPSLGRPLSAGAANVTVSLIEPGSQYAARVNQVDLRVGKILRFGGLRTAVNLDLFNVLNSGAVLQVNNTFNPAIPTLWMRPQSVMQPRLLKFSAQIDF